MLALLATKQEHAGTAGTKLCGAVCAVQRGVFSWRTLSGSGYHSKRTVRGSPRTLLLGKPKERAVCCRNSLSALTHEKEVLTVRKALAEKQSRYCAVLTKASAEACVFCMRCADVHVQKVAALLEQVNAFWNP